MGTWQPRSRVHASRYPDLQLSLYQAYWGNHLFLVSPQPTGGSPFLIVTGVSLEHYFLQIMAVDWGQTPGTL